MATLIDRVKPYTKSDYRRLASMYEALQLIDEDRIPGDVVECGVWRGGNIMLARLKSPARRCWLYDTFDGMTVPDAEFDVKRSGDRAIDRYNAKKNGGTKWDAVSLQEVKDGFAEIGLTHDELSFVVGPVEQTLQLTVPSTIALLRLDLDWHSPTRKAMEILYPLLSPNGFLIVDDYGHWLGCKKAIDEYFGPFVPLYFDVDYSCRVFRKC